MTPDPVANPQRRRNLAASGFVGLLLGAAVFALPHFIPEGGSWAADFRVFYSAAVVIAHGGNPYHQATIVAVEQHVRRSQAAPVAGSNYAYLPVVAWVLIPLTLLPFWLAWTCFTVLAVTLTGCSVYALTRHFGWGHPAVAVTTVELLWVSLWGYLLGQFDALLLAALTAALLSRLHGRGLVAGAVLATALVKPQLLLPAVPLLVLSFWPDRRATLRCAAGFLMTSVVLLVADTVVTPGLLRPWWHYLHQFAAAVPQTQFGLAGLSGLTADMPRSWGLTDAVTSGLAVGLATAGVLVAAVLAVRFAVDRCRGRGGSGREIVLSVMLPFSVWLLVTPYSHLNDLLLLLPLLLVLVGVDCVDLRGAAVWMAMVAFSLFPYIESFVGFRVDILPIVVLFAVVAGWTTAFPWRRPGSGTVPGLS